MAKAVIKDASYSLFHTPEMLIHLGVTQVNERLVNPDSEYLNNIESYLRDFEQVVNYLPNQVYIGNLHPRELVEKERPFVNLTNIGQRFGKLGEIMPEKELLLYVMICDVFELVMLEESFLTSAISEYAKHPLKTDQEIEKVQGKGSKIEKIKESLKNGSEPLYYEGQLIGCVKKAHDIDVNLNAHVMTENLVVKATGALTMKHLLSKNAVKAEEIGYVIECSEEACGDMNQRGGGNFAKAIAEMCGAKNAGGCDIRAFCAAPTHSLIHAATLVESGVYDNVVVVAGGATAKLGMNGKDHAKKGYKLLEDVLGGFAVLISKNDGISPVIRTDVVGTHKVGTASSPQAVTKSLVEQPLKEAGLKISEVDKFSVEMQNPDITSIAGAGDVPLANYKMIAALAVMNKEIERSDINNFALKHGMVGWAPTQGHIPSGIPYCGFAIEDMTTDTGINRAMIIGKGSLFLGRMTNVFDGISVMIERNSGVEETSSVSKEEINKLIANSLKQFANSLLSE